MRNSAISSLTWSIGKAFVSHRKFLSHSFFPTKTKNACFFFNFSRYTSNIFFSQTWQIVKLLLLSLAYVFFSPFCWRLVFPSRRFFFLLQLEQLLLDEVVMDENICFLPSISLLFTMIELFSIISSLIIESGRGCYGGYMLWIIENFLYLQYCVVF